MFVMGENVMKVRIIKWIINGVIWLLGFGRKDADIVQIIKGIIVWL